MGNSQIFWDSWKQSDGSRVVLVPVHAPQFNESCIALSKNTYLVPVPRELRLFILVTQLEMAGAQKVAIEQARYFHQRGYQVMLCFLYDKQGLLEDLRSEIPCSVVSLDLKRKNIQGLFQFARGLRKLWVLLKQNGYDIIHTHTHYASIIGAIVGRYAGISVIATQHTSLSRFPRWFWLLSGIVMNSSCVCKVIAVSHETRRFCIEQMRVRENKVVMIYNGVNARDYDPQRISSGTKHELRRSLGLSDTDAVILTVARLAPEKGHRYLIDAAVHILDQRPDTRFLFVGDGPLRGILEEQVKSLNFHKQILFLGLRRDIAELLSITDIFVLPATNEAMPLSVLEAMASEVPVVATDVGGLKEVVEDGLSGFVVPPANSEALAHAILTLLNDEALSRRMREHGRERVAGSFAWESTFAQYEALYQEFLR